MTVLHITNGDNAVDLLREARDVHGDIIAWRDVLYEGPVPANFDLDALSQQRIQYLCNTYGHEHGVIAKDFIDRDTCLKHYQNYSEIVLWFEHDLYDQLQLLQILAWFAACEPTTIQNKLTLICINKHAEVTPFLGLGQLSSPQINALLSTGKIVGRDVLELARQAWQAFTSDKPQDLVTLLQTADLAVMPFLKNALLRHLSEFPDKENGLSFTEHFILQQVEVGNEYASTIFTDLPEYEADYYMGLGDVGFWQILNGLIATDAPLLMWQESSDIPHDMFASQGHVLQLTQLAKDILAGNSIWQQHHQYNRWHGGTHVNNNNLWLWDAKQQLLLRN